MQAKGTAPERLTPEGVESEYLPAIAHKLRGVIADGGIVPLQPFIAVITISSENATQKDHRDEREACSPSRFAHTLQASAPAECAIELATAA